MKKLFAWIKWYGMRRRFLFQAVGSVEVVHFALGVRVTSWGFRISEVIWTQGIPFDVIGLYEEEPA